MTFDSGVVMTTTMANVLIGAGIGLGSIGLGVAMWLVIGRIIEGHWSW